MPRAKLPNTHDMTVYVASWLRTQQGRADVARALDTGDYTPLAIGGLPLDDAVKTHYRAWQLVQLAQDKGEPLSDVSVRRLLDGVPPGEHPATLTKHRVVYVRPLGTFVRLPVRTPKTNLEAAVRLGIVEGVLVRTPDEEHGLYVGLSNEASTVIERAMRGKNWTHNLYQDEEHPTLGVEYRGEGLSDEANVERVRKLDPRMGDISRFFLAKALEKELGAGGTQARFIDVTVSLNEIARALGYRPHPKGGMRAEDLVKTHDAISDLESLYLVRLPDGSQQLQVGRSLVSRDGRPLRPPGVRLFALMRTDVVDERTPAERVVGGRRLTNVFTFVLGDWAREYQRNYAPIFRSIIELPANTVVNVWVKQFAMELAFLFVGGRQTQRLTLRVEDLLRRASVLDEVEKLRERRRPQEAVRRFEEVLDTLGKLGVHDGWAYTPESESAIGQADGKRWLLDVWLAADVTIKPPVALLSTFSRMLESGQDT
ncbi:hypothetical protein [Deinococcus pimensis]|uniref:hypothetical protein n=1 Tax=Deinococcus pimensis TaxID=309888 RepID=UPI0004895B67|nr:hypothetical protein [Deinococcus pimensis]